jgi:hypothetical protein
MSDQAMKNHEWLETAARRALEHDWLLAGVLHEYKRLEGIDEPKLLERLGCDQERARLLSLCRCPRPDEFEEDVREIAERLALDPERLAAVLSSVAVLGTLGAAARTDRPGVMLLAARDHESEDDEE